jgi:hypothetical protein
MLVDSLKKTDRKGQGQFILPQHEKSGNWEGKIKGQEKRKARHSILEDWLESNAHPTKLAYGRTLKTLCVLGNALRVLILCLSPLRSDSEIRIFDCNFFREYRHRKSVIPSHKDEMTTQVFRLRLDGSLAATR